MHIDSMHAGEGRIPWQPLTESILSVVSAVPACIRGSGS